MKTSLLKSFCPHCVDDVDSKLVDLNEIIEVKGEQFSVSSPVLRCEVCKNVYNNNEFPNLSHTRAYSQYRTKYRMLSPNQIKNFREKLCLTQKELALLLDWGEVTLSRYERGALQDGAHDKALKMSMTKDGMRVLYEDAKRAGLSKDLLNKVKRWLDGNDLETYARPYARALYISTSFEPSLSGERVKIADHKTVRKNKEHAVSQSVTRLFYQFKES